MWSDFQNALESLGKRSLNTTVKDSNRISSCHDFKVTIKEPNCYYPVLLSSLCNNIIPCSVKILFGKLLKIITFMWYLERILYTNTKHVHQDWNRQLLIMFAIHFLAYRCSSVML